MSCYNDLMSKIADKGLLFNVDQQRMTTDSGISVPGKKALINTSTGKVMSVVSDGYKVVSNEQIFDSFCKALDASHLDTQGADVSVYQTDTGSRAIVDFTFPAMRVSVPGDASETALQICALNSFDGSTRYITKAGGLRMKCLNGQILGSIVSSFSGQHTKNLDVEVGSLQIINMIQEFQSAKEYWSRLMRTEIGDHTATEVFYQFLNISNLTDTCKAPAYSGIGNYRAPERQNSRLDRCLKLWGEYKRELGNNAYALYNALTHYVSHQDKDYKCPTKALQRERTRLQSTFDDLTPKLAA